MRQQLSYDKYLYLYIFLYIIIYIFIININQNIIEQRFFINKIGYFSVSVANLVKLLSYLCTGFILSIYSYLINLPRLLLYIILLYCINIALAILFNFSYSILIYNFFDSVIQFLFFSTILSVLIINHKLVIGFKNSFNNSIIRQLKLYILAIIVGYFILSYFLTRYFFIGNIFYSFFLCITLFVITFILNNRINKNGLGNFVRHKILIGNVSSRMLIELICGFILGYILIICLNDHVKQNKELMNLINITDILHYFIIYSVVIAYLVYFLSTRFDIYKLYLSFLMLFIFSCLLNYLLRLNIDIKLFIILVQFSIIYALFLLNLKHIYVKFNANTILFGLNIYYLFCVIGAFSGYIISNILYHSYLTSLINSCIIVALFFISYIALYKANRLNKYIPG